MRAAHLLRGASGLGRATRRRAPASALLALGHSASPRVKRAHYLAHFRGKREGAIGKSAPARAIARPRDPRTIARSATPGSASFCGTPRCFRSCSKRAPDLLSFFRVVGDAYRVLSV